MIDPLPAGWWRDRIVREYVHDEIRRYLSRGMTDTEVADRVGCDPKSVLRYRQERHIPPFLEAA